MKKLFLICMLVFTLISYSFAQDTSKVLVLKNLLTSEQLQLNKQQSTVETLGQYVGLGREIGVAVKDGLNAVVDVSERVGDTKVGKFTMFLIAYKVIGDDVVEITIGFIVWIILITIVTISYFKTCIPRKMFISSVTDVQKNCTKTWEVINGKNERRNSDCITTIDARRISHAIIGVVVTVIMLIVMLV